MISRERDNNFEASRWLYSYPPPSDQRPCPRKKKLNHVPLTPFNSDRLGVNVFPLKLNFEVSRHAFMLSLIIHYLNFQATLFYPFSRKTKANNKTKSASCIPSGRDMKDQHVYIVTMSAKNIHTRFVRKVTHGVGLNQSQLDLPW